HHLAEMFLALPSSPVSPPPALPAPQTFRQHPSSERLPVHLHTVLGSQMLHRQRRAKSLSHRPAVLLPHQPQRLPPQLLRIGPVRPPPRAAVLQPVAPPSWYPSHPRPVCRYLRSPRRAASTKRSSSLPTRASTSTRPSSRSLIPVLLNVPSFRRSH